MKAIIFDWQLAAKVDRPNQWVKEGKEVSEGHILIYIVPCCKGNMHCQLIVKHGHTNMKGVSNVI